MLRQDEERGFDPLDDPPPPPGPAEHVAPLIRPGIPAPDWRAEEEERAQGDTA
jgi:hypothetical protein